MSKQITIQQNWYQDLLQDLKKLEFTGIVLTKWNIGKRILQDELKFGKPEYGSKRIENLCKDMGYGKTDVYACVQFAKNYLEIPTTWENSSWHQVRNNLLPKPRKQKSEIQSLPKGKYNIIYADPAWEYWGGGYKNQSQHYDVMDYKEIIKLPI